jgi:hypothetical protein
MRRNIELLVLVVLAALSVMAVTAAGAQAAGEFRVEGKVLKEGEEAVLEGSGGASKLTVPSLGLTIECSSVLLEAHVTNIPFVHAHEKHHWMHHFCFIEGFEEVCTIYPTEADRTKETFGGLLLSLNLFLEGLFGFSHYWLYKLIEKFYFGGEECPFGEEEVKVTGESAVKFGSATTEATAHTMEDVTAKEEKELGLTGLSFNGEPAEMSGGNTTVKLVGALAGKKYSLN